MPKQIIIAEQHRIAAVFWEDQIQELVVATGQHQVGDVYLGIVENILPGIDAAFVNIGDANRNGFIHVTDLGPLRLRRSAGAITELLTPQQKVLVQVMKEPTSSKGPRLTGNITLPGRYIVLMPFGRGVNLSRRIRSEAERNRLRALAVLIKPSGMGVLVRTEAEGKAEEAIIEDLELLQKQWEAVQQEANSTRAPALLDREDDFIQRVLRDMYSADVNRIVVDTPTGVKRVKQHLLTWSGGKAPEGVLIDYHNERQLILEYFRVNAAVREALKPRVELPSGGYIIIEPTEALTVIDVNSGSFTRSATARETVLWTNCEAATEIARQLRLRNLAGVIVVDFIDMDARKDQLQVLEHFNKQLRADKARPQIAQLSELGLVELTRKRMGQNIYELFGHTCPTCGGFGHLVRLPAEQGRNGEVGEPSAPVPLVPLSARETRVVNPANTGGGRETPTPDTWDNEENELLDLALEDNEELDLVNHPSYQEQAGVNKYRRRRRTQVKEVPLREESIKINPRLPVRPALANQFKPDNIAEPDEQAQTTTTSSAELFPMYPTESERVERPQRTNKPSRQEAEPPEIVTVEMTPEEQDVYAMMGISPLVRLARQVKNPKSAIIAVIPSGDLAATQLPASLSSVVPTEKVVEPEASSAQPFTSEELVEPTTTETDVLTQTPESDESDSNPSVNRRRRRRSSALGI